MNRGARREAEDAGTAAPGYELRERRGAVSGGGVAVAGGDFAVEELEHVIETTVCGLD